jgi:hypothetical protein
MKHTRGPWQIDFEVSEDGPVIAGKSGKVFAQIYGPKKSAAANARLIAAAPELLKALKDLRSEVIVSGCQDYMNEASQYAEAFNSLMDNVESLIVSIEREVS